MLLDHIGALFVPGYTLRIIGRLSFPIFCFLIAEGAYHTRNPKRYALRLGLSALITELPYDLAFYGGWNWNNQNVMVTLLCGFLVLWLLRREGTVWLKLIVTAVLALMAEWMNADYGAEGVILIVLFGITREIPCQWLLRSLGMLLIFVTMSSPVLFRFAGFPVTLQMLGVFAMIPIALYSGKKTTNSKLALWGFYLFYPVHLVVLYLLQ